MPTSAARAIADATAALTDERDVTDVLARLVHDCCEVLSADAIGVLVLVGQTNLELLASTSHSVAELELFQIQHDAGPCVDAIRSSTRVVVLGAEQLIERWPVVGQAIVAAGYQAVHAYPMRWRGHTLGAMNVFHADPGAVTDDGMLYGQAFADIATVLIVQRTDIDLQQVSQQVQQVLQARTTIELAKGVLAYQHDIDLAGAYDLLRGLAGPDSTLTAAATEVIARAQDRPES
jgi:transcriptional regulator with GAF, ATPase, and Fis domain